MEGSVIESPAVRVRKMFGGARELGRLIKLSPEQVYRWSYPKDRGGCDGEIPARHHIPILTAAREKGIDLKPVDLMPWLAEESAVQ